MAEQLECRAKDKTNCEGKIDEYYCTDGSLITLCVHHLKTCMVVVWYQGVPMTKEYYEEVYDQRDKWWDWT